MYHDPKYSAEIEQTANQIALVQKYNRDVRDGTIAMEQVPCLCGGETFDIVATYERNRAHQPIVLCHQCSLMQNRPRYTEESNNWFYTSDVYRELNNPGGFKVPNSKEFIAHAKSRDPLRERAIKGLDEENIKTVAEIGCANGMNLYGFHLEGRVVFGCDLSPKMIAMGKTMGMDLHEGSVETLGDKKFDLIILAHVLEHMRDPIGEIKKIISHMNDDGGLYIEVPDAKSFFLSALQSAHLYYFTPKTLVHHLAPLGLKPVSQSNANEIHFGIVFKKTNEAQIVDISEEYAKLRKVIVTTDRRDRLKDVLVKFNILPILKLIRKLIRR